MIELRQVARQGKRSSTRRANFAHERLEVIGATGGYGNARTHQRDRPTNAPGCAGDERGLPTEIYLHGSIITLPVLPLENISSKALPASSSLKTCPTCGLTAPLISSG